MTAHYLHVYLDDDGETYVSPQPFDDADTALDDLADPESDRGVYLFTAIIDAAGVARENWEDLARARAASWRREQALLPMTGVV